MEVCLKVDSRRVGKQTTVSVLDIETCCVHNLRDKLMGLGSEKKEKHFLLTAVKRKLPLSQLILLK